jgi:hypothetical protein
MSVSILTDQIEFKYDPTGQTIVAVYLQQRVPLTDPSGNVVSYSINRVPIDPTSTDAKTLLASIKLPS